MKLARGFWKSLKKIATAEQYNVIRALFRRELSPIDPERFPETANWERRCYHTPSRRELVLAAIDECLETFGVEGFQTRRGWLSYCNTGDSYAPTVCERDGIFFIASWGDIVEVEGI